MPVGITRECERLTSGHCVLFTPRDIPGVWPMARHYSSFGPNPAATGEYNPLQKLAYASTIRFGVLSRLTGIVLFKPAQFSLPAFSIQRVSSDARVAFRGDVRVTRVYFRAPDHGSARLVKFLLHAFRMEARACVSGIGNQTGVMGNGRCAFPSARQP
jgi:hypothetical protein